MKRSSFLPIHLLGSHHCVSTLYYLTLLRLSRCVLSPRSPRTLPLKPSRNTSPKGPCPPQPASWSVRHFWNLGASSLFSLTESCTHTLIHLPFLSACAFLLQRASSFRSVLEGAAPPTPTIWEALLELGTSLSKHSPPGASASTHMH